MLDRLIMLGCTACGLILFVFVLGVLSSCDPSTSQFTETHNAEGVDFPLKVHVFENETQLNRAVEDLEGAPGVAVDGIAQARVDAIGNVRRCDIYVVRPKHATDYNQQETWGHELMHCVYGLYHKEGVR